MCGTIGPWEGAIILVVALLLFGNRLPEVMRSMGRGVAEFKKGMREAENEIESTEKGAGEKKSKDGDKGDSDFHPPAPKG